MKNLSRNIILVLTIAASFAACNKGTNAVSPKVTGTSGKVNSASITLKRKDTITPLVRRDTITPLLKRDTITPLLRKDTITPLK